MFLAFRNRLNGSSVWRKNSKLWIHQRLQLKRRYNWLSRYKKTPKSCIALHFFQLSSGWRGPSSYPDIPVMVWWTPFTGDDGLQQCGEYQCYVTNDRAVREHPNTKAIVSPPPPYNTFFIFFMCT